VRKHGASFLLNLFIVPQLSTLYVWKSVMDPQEDNNILTDFLFYLLIIYFNSFRDNVILLKNFILYEIFFVNLLKYL